MSEQPVADFLYGGRHTVSQAGPFSSAIDLESFLASERVDYILVGPALRWQALCVPTYSRSTALLLPLLAELSSTGSIRPVYSAEPDRIAIYRIEP